MDLKDDLELAMTRTKLQRLEARYEAARIDTHENSRVREATMRSLKGTINQFKEEIARYLAHKSTSPSGDTTVNEYDASVHSGAEAAQ